MDDCLILNDLEPVTYKNYIIESSDFFYALIEFISRHNTTKDFSKAIITIKNVLRELRNQNNDYAWRINRIIQQKHIELDEE